MVRFPQSHRRWTIFPGYHAYLTHVLRTGVYAGSKAALETITDALRLELAPLGVKVVTLHTGAVNSHTLDAGKGFHSPKDSFFKDLEKIIARRARGEEGTPRMTANDFTERVVPDILRGGRAQIWRGGYASVVRFVSLCFPASLSVRAGLFSNLRPITANDQRLVR